MRRKSLCGMSLTELIASLSIFVLFSIVLVVCLIAGLRFGERAGARSDIQQTMMKAESLIVADFRQAIAFTTQEAIVRLWGNNKVNLFTPNPTNPATGEVYFTIPNFSFFPPGAVSLTFSSPECFQTIHYYIENASSLVREKITYDAGGRVIRTDRHRMIAVPDKELRLDAEYVSSSRIRVTLRESSSKDSFKISFNAYSENDWSP
jgi:hypothetical protein